MPARSSDIIPDVNQPAHTSKSPPVPASINLGHRAAFFGVRVYAFAAAVFLAALLFEAIVSGRMPLRTNGLHAVAVTTGNLGIQAAAESLDWRGAAMLLIGTALGGLGVAAYTLRLAWREERRACRVLLGVGLVVAVLVFLIQMLGPTSYLVELVRHIDAQRQDSPAIAPLLLVPKRFGEVIAGVVGIAMAATLLLPGTLDSDGLAERVRRLRLVLYVSAAMLTVGVLVAQTSYAWAASMCVEPEALKPIVEGGTRLAAAFYTLVLAAGYVPAAIVMNRLGARLAEVAVSRGEAESAEAWMTTSGLHNSPQAQILRLLTVVAPALSAAVPQFAQFIGGG